FPGQLGEFRGHLTARMGRRKQSAFRPAAWSWICAIGQWAALRNERSPLPQALLSISRSHEAPLPLSNIADLLGEASNDKQFRGLSVGQASMYGPGFGFSGSAHKPKSITLHGFDQLGIGVLHDFKIGLRLRVISLGGVS